MQERSKMTQDKAIEIVNFVTNALQESNDITTPEDAGNAFTNFIVRKDGNDVVVGVAHNDPTEISFELLREDVGSLINALLVRSYVEILLVNSAVLEKYGCSVNQVPVE